MSEVKTLTLDGTEYNIADLNDEQKVLVSHLMDLERKIKSAQFNLDQLNVGHMAFVNMLKQKIAEEA